MRNEGKVGKTSGSSGTNVVSGNSKPRTTKDMEYKDLKELAWEEYGRESYEAEMRLRFLMEGEGHCIWGVPTEDEIDELNLRLKRGEL
jgi:hypothetical protein